MSNKCGDCRFWQNCNSSCRYVEPGGAGRQQSAMLDTEACLDFRRVKKWKRDEPKVAVQLFGGMTWEIAPQSIKYDPEPEVLHIQGLSLRDYFAGQALVCPVLWGDMDTSDMKPDEWAKLHAQRVYRIADAMLVARERKPKNKETKG